MLTLYLLSAHMVGDYVLQSRWQAAGKFGDSWRAVRLRLAHVTTYTLCFVPIAAVYAPAWWKALLFTLGLFVAHFYTDRQRVYSTLGDEVQWRLDFRHDPEPARAEWLDYAIGRTVTSIRSIDLNDRYVRRPTPNPWPPTAMMVDQTLHLVQLAILGGLLLT